MIHKCDVCTRNMGLFSFRIIFNTPVTFFFSSSILLLILQMLLPKLLTHFIMYVRCESNLWCCKLDSLSVCLSIVVATLSWNIFHCLSSGGRIFSWGWNEHGMCGDGSLCDIAQPRPVPGLTDATALLIGCGAGHSMALCSLKSNEDSAS